MKRILVIALVLFITAIGAQAQNAGGSKQPGTKKATSVKQRGTGQYYGSRDTTPGSPMGTGGTGEGMSGSPAGSALETREHQTEVRDSLNNAAASNAVNTTTKKTRSTKQTTTRKKQ